MACQLFLRFWIVPSVYQRIRLGNLGGGGADFLEKVLDAMSRPSRVHATEMHVHMHRLYFVIFIVSLRYFSIRGQISYTGNVIYVVTKRELYVCLYWLARPWLSSLSLGCICFRTLGLLTMTAATDVLDQGSNNDMQRLYLTR